jgi:putative ABC transport system permease protein
MALTSNTVLLLGRTDRDPARSVSLFERLVYRVDPDLVVTSATTGERFMAGGYYLMRGVATVSVALAGLAIVLAMLGLYGLLSQVVSRRTREIGIRVALGAGANHVRWLVVQDGLKPVFWGLAAGLFAGTSARMIVRALEPQASIPMIDPLAGAIAVVTLVAAGIIASYVPARRASMVDPNIALRHL